MNKKHERAFNLSISINNNIEKGHKHVIAIICPMQNLHEKNRYKNGQTINISFLDNTEMLMGLLAYRYIPNNYSKNKSMKV